MPVKEAEATNSLADQGVDVFTMHVDGPVIVETAAKRGQVGLRLPRQPGQAGAQAYLTGAEWNWLTAYKQIIDAAVSGKPHPNFIRGGLKDGFVKMSPYGSAGARGRAQAGRGRSSARWWPALRHLQGELKDNTGKEVIPAGKAFKQTDLELEGMNYLVEGVIGKDLTRCQHARAPPPTDMRLPVLAWPPLLLFGLSSSGCRGHDPLEAVGCCCSGGPSATPSPLAEHAAARRAADADGAGGGAAGAGRAGDRRRGALVLGGWPAPPAALPAPAGAIGRHGAGAAAGALGAARWDGAGRRLRQWRGVNETISRLLLGYIAIALFKHGSKGRCATRPA